MGRERWGDSTPPSLTRPLTLTLTLTLILTLTIIVTVTVTYAYSSLDRGSRCHPELQGSRLSTDPHPHPHPHPHPEVR